MEAVEDTITGMFSISDLQRYW